MDKVYVITVEHEHGSDIFVGETHLAAQQLLYQYCCDWWGDARKNNEALPEEPYDDMEQTISTYFDAMDYHENYDDRGGIEPAREWTVA